MLILDYFKKKLPDPKGTLSRTMSIHAISCANEEVEASCKRLGTGKKRNVFTPKERVELGKLACQIRATAATSQLINHVEFILTSTCNRKILCCCFLISVCLQHG